jgi:hypothetical protein
VSRRITRAAPILPQGAVAECYRPSARRPSVLLIPLAACWLLTGCGEPERPNLLILVSDALRADALSCYGGRAETPNLCRLAERGVLFEHAFANAPWTLPSSISMFTGRPSGWYRRAAGPEELELGARFYRVPDEERLLGEVLGELGYRAPGPARELGGWPSEGLPGPWSLICCVTMRVSYRR